MSQDHQQEQQVTNTPEEKECVGLECYFDKHPEEKKPKRSEYEGEALDPANIAARSQYGMSFRDPYESGEERMSGQALERYYYWSDGIMPPHMQQTQGAYMRPQKPYRPLQVDNYEMNSAIPARYDYVTSQYDSEYGDVSDLYGAYLENRDLNEYRRHRGIDALVHVFNILKPQNRNAIKIPLLSPKKYWKKSQRKRCAMSVAF